MKKNQLPEFKLIYIKDDAIGKNIELKMPKYIPDTPLDTFPILYIKEDVKQQKQQETKIYNSNDIFVSPIVGIQKNERVSGVDHLTSNNSYQRFEKTQEKLMDKKKIKNEFDLLDSDDYIKILEKGYDNHQPSYDDLGFDFNGDESLDDAPIKADEKIKPIYSEEDYQQSATYEYIEEEPAPIKEEPKKVNIPKQFNQPNIIVENDEENDDEEFNEDSILNEQTNNQPAQDLIQEMNNEEIIEQHRIRQIDEQPIVKPLPKAKHRQKYVAPPLSLLNKNSGEIVVDDAWAQEKQNIINKVFAEFNYGAKAIGYKVGPTVTLFLIDIEPGTDVNKLNSFSNTLQMRLKAMSLRIQSPIIGFDCAGVEIANEHRTTVLLGNLMTSELMNSPKKLQFPLGLNVNGEVAYADIEKMPHGLFAGRTGSGKSVCMNTMIVTLLYRNSPEELRFIMIDPKTVELTPYSDIPHLAMPVITEPKKAATAFKWACEEMDRRFFLFSQFKVRNIDGYNQVMRKNQNQILPKIVIVIDELADLMLVVGAEIETYIMRLGAKARAAGIHVILATQRPSTDVIKGTMKNNIPTRIAFKVSSPTDSTTILDHGGAEKLLGLGDMLYKTEYGEERIQGAYIDDNEINPIVNFLSENNEQVFLIDDESLNQKVIEIEEADEDDDMFEEIAYFCVRNQTASTNQIQKTFKMSFNRADRIVQKMEKLGIVSSTVRGKSREVIVNEDKLNDILDNR